MPSRVAFDNTTRVIGQTVHKTRPCDLCGTFAGVFVTWAVPLDAGGLESGWNLTSLCNPCRRWRKRQHLNPGADAQSKPPAAKPRGQRVEVNGRMFANVIEAARFFDVSRQTVYNWIYGGHNGARYLTERE